MDIFFTMSQEFQHIVKVENVPSISTLLYIDGLVQDCSNSSALAMELLQSCAKPSIYACTDFWIVYDFTETEYFFPTFFKRT